jgi:gluconokinase
MTDPRVLVVMGVSGSGKTTIGKLLAERLGWPYADGDAFHSEANIDKMAMGEPLDDGDRAPWLAAIAGWIDRRIACGETGVVSCSALKRRYRDVLRRPAVRFVYLDGAVALIAPRMASRHGHFFKREMLASQLADLEPPAADEAAISVAIDGSPAETVDAIVGALAMS